MSAKVPRWYQAEAIDAGLAALLRPGEHPILAMPTGSGKALTVAELARMLMTERRIVIVAPTRKLVAQNYETLLAQLDPAARACVGIVCSGLKRADTRARIILATPGSIVNRLRSMGQVDTMFIDECQIVNQDDPTTTWAKIVRTLAKTSPDCQFCGLSATPFRMRQGKPIFLHEMDKPLFTSIAYDLTSPAKFMRLVHEGYLAPLTQYQGWLPQIDISDIKLNAEGDFNETQLAEEVAAHLEEYVDAVVAAVPPERRCVMVFVPGIDIANATADLLRARGQTCVVVHGRQENDENDEAMEAFAVGDARFIVSVAQLTTGFDVRQIDAIVIMRPTRSLVLYVQIMGRGTRIAPDYGKTDCMVFDLAGVVAYHGPVNALRELHPSEFDRTWMCADAFDTPSPKGLLKFRQPAPDWGDSPPPGWDYYPNAEGETCYRANGWDIGLEVGAGAYLEPCGAMNLDTEMECICGRTRPVLFVADKPRAAARDRKSLRDDGDEDIGEIMTGADAEHGREINKPILSCHLFSEPGTSALRLVYSFMDGTSMEQVMQFGPGIYAHQDVRQNLLWRKFWMKATPNAPHEAKNTVTAWALREHFEAPTAMVFRPGEGGQAVPIGVVWEKPGYKAHFYTTN